MGHTCCKIHYPMNHVYCHLAETCLSVTWIAVVNVNGGIGITDKTFEYRRRKI